MSAQEDLVVSNAKYEIQACILCSSFVIQGSLRVRPTSFLTFLSQGPSSSLEILGTGRLFSAPIYVFLEE